MENYDNKILNDIQEEINIEFKKLCPTINMNSNIFLIDKNAHLEPNKLNYQTS